MPDIQDLRPDMVLWNATSNRFARVRGKKGESLPVPRKAGCVEVHWQSGGVWQYGTWSLKNVTIVPVSRQDVRPGMKVHKLNDIFSAGVIHKDRSGKMPACVINHIVVKRRYRSGKNQGKMGYFRWPFGTFYIES